MTQTSRKHRKKVKHFHNPGDLHELTFSCYQRLPLLTNDVWRKILSRSIDEANREEAIDLVAFVYMPEHVHLLVYPTTPDPAIGRYLARIKHAALCWAKPIVRPCRKCFS